MMKLLLYLILWELQVSLTSSEATTFSQETTAAPFPETRIHALRTDGAAFYAKHSALHYLLNWPEKTIRPALK